MALGHRHQSYRSCTAFYDSDGLESPAATVLPEAVGTGLTGRDAQMGGMLEHLDAVGALSYYL